MFNIGFGEMVMLAAIALIFIGPKQLPEVARVVGRMLNELRRASDELTGSFVKTRDDVNREFKKVEKKVSDIAINATNLNSKESSEEKTTPKDHTKDDSQKGHS